MNMRESMSEGGTTADSSSAHSTTSHSTTSHSRTAHSTTADSGTADGSSMEAADIAPDLGLNLRRRRKTAGLTMQELADRCGLSQPFLSQIENSRAMPSLFALHRVAQALGTTTVGLLDPESSEVTLVRGNESDGFVLSEGARTRFLTPGEGHRLEANEQVAEAGITSDTTAHEGEELIRVLEGSIVLRLQGRDPVELHPGDTILYPATTPHQWISGQAGARFLIVSSPPSF